MERGQPPAWLLLRNAKPRNLIRLIILFMYAISLSAQSNRSEPIVANLGLGPSNLALWAILPFEVPLPALGPEVRIKIDDVRVLRALSASEVSLYAIAVPDETSSTISTIPADASGSTLLQLAQQAQSSRRLDWAIALKLNMKWLPPNLVFSVADRSAVLAVAPGKAPPQQPLIETLNGTSPFIVQRYSLDNVKLQIGDNKNLELNIAPLFTASGMTLVGREGHVLSSPTIAGGQVPYGDTRITVPIAMLNRISQIGYSDKPIPLQAGQGQTIQLSNIKATGSPGKLTLSADIGPTIPGCNVHATTMWSGTDLSLSSISIKGDTTLPCQPEVGKWQLIAGALNGMYAAGKTKLRPTSMTAIPTSISGRPIALIVTVTNTWTNGSSVIVTAKVGFRTQ